MKNQVAFTLLISTSILFLFSSCYKEVDPINLESCRQFSVKPVLNTDNITSLPEANETFKVCGLLPISKNTYWIYRDSIFNNAGMLESVIYDTVRFEKQILSTADNSIWWKVNSARPKGICKYAFTTDSTLYALDKPSFGTNQTLKAYEWLQVLTQDSVRKGNLLSDMAYIEITKKLKTKVITVPQGTYTDCIETTKFLGNNNDQIIFKPAIGVLKYITYQVAGNPFNIQYSQRRQVSELVHFSN